MPVADKYNFHELKISPPILIVGAGSIGRQHLNNLVHLGYTDLAVVTRYPEGISQFGNVRIFSELIAALNAGSYAYVLICNPTSLHLDTLKLVLQAGIKNIYLEKPVSHNFRQVEELKDFILQKNANVVVGYDLRFDPVMKKAQELISTGFIGKITSVNAEVGQYLPDWRPCIDYRNSMSASISKGGGVMLDLIHEFDYVYYLLGEIKWMACMYRRSGQLEIETEDVCNVLLEFHCGATGSIHLDYLKANMQRKCTIIGSGGMIQMDFVEKALLLTDLKQNVRRFSYPGFVRNDRLRESLQCFLDGERNAPFVSFEEACYSLEMVMAAKRSSEEKMFIELKPETTCLS